MQIYENLFKQETEEKLEKGEIRFDNRGKVIYRKKRNGSPPSLTLTSALRPLLEFVDGYRRRVAAP